MISANSSHRSAYSVGLALAAIFAPAALAAQEPWPEAADPTPVLEIGEETGSGDAYLFTDITAIEVVGDSIFVLDAEAREVRVFDHAGRFLLRIGRAGEGPGELEWPTRMRVRPDGIEVVDLRLRRRTFFAMDGSLRRTESLGQPGGMLLSDFVALDGGWSLGETAVFMSSREGSHPTRSVVLIDPAGTRIDTLAGFSIGAVPFTAEGTFGFLRTRTGAGGDWAVVHDSLLVLVAGHPPVLGWWTAGSGGLDRRGRVELPIEPAPLARDDERALLEAENRRRRGEGADPLPRTTKLDPPEYWGQVGDLVVSDDHHCWIRWDRPRTDDDPYWFVVDLETGDVARAALPAGFRLLAAARGRLYGYRLTALDVPVIHVLRLTAGR